MFQHWQVPLSKRFRALKLWFVIRSFGVHGLQEHVREVNERNSFYFSKVECDVVTYRLTFEDFSSR